MSNSMAVPVLTCQLTASGQSRFTQTNSSLDVNGFLFDVSFTVPASYTNKWEFLRDVFVNIAFRVGSGSTGTQIALISNVPLYDLLMLSDYEAGVSMKSTDFTQGEVARISGYVPIGYFSMGSRDALDVSVSLGNAVSMSVDLNISAIYTKSMDTLLLSYASCAPTGADQPYTNVLALYYCGTDNIVNDSAVIRENDGSTKSVNLEDAIAYSNAVGNFEFFTRFAQFYIDTFGVTRDITFRCPVISGDSKPTVLVKRVEFNPALLGSNAQENRAEFNALLTKIKETDAQKYAYLKAIGVA